MPTYDFKCSNCHKTFENFSKLADYKSEISCPHCNHIASRVYSVRSAEPKFTEKIYPLWDQSVNVVFNSQNQRNRWMKENGYVLREDSMTRKQCNKAYRQRIGYHDPSLRRYAEIAK